MSHPDDTKLGPNPSGYCLCGCGQETPTSAYNDPRTGTVKGHPVRYIKGHIRRVGVEQYTIDPKTGCWNWSLGTKHGGYSHMRDGGKNTAAHRIFYERFKGPIPAGLQIDHLCRNRLCVNPDHLEAVTAEINQHRRTDLKLNEQSVREIRALFESGITKTELARKFFVSYATVHYVISRKRWGGVD